MDADKKLKDMTEEEFQERGMMDVFHQVQGVLQEHPEITAAALAQVKKQVTKMGAKKNEPLTNATDDELKQAGLTDSSGNMLASVKAAMHEHPHLTIAAGLAKAGLAVAAGVYDYKAFSPDNTPLADVPQAELQERGLLDSSGNMLASVKEKVAQNPKLTIAAALVATGLVVAGGVALSHKLSPDDTPVADVSNEELQQRGLVDSAGNLLEPVKAAMAENPKMSIAAALAATGLVIAGGIALHHSSAADTQVADMSDDQLGKVGLLDPSGGLLASVKGKVAQNPKLAVAAALGAAAAAGGGALKDDDGKKHKEKKGKKEKGEKKEKKEKGAKKEKKDKKEKRDLADAEDSSSTSDSDSE